MRQIRTRDGVTTTTDYVHPDNQGGLLFEKVVTGSTTTYRHYINGGGGVAAVVETTGAAPAVISKTEYWHKDHLGSVAVISNESGVEIPGTRRYYDAWGKANVAGADYRGFTGHEQFDEFDLVHMNGRTYIAALGRFMSADPFIQDPDNLQSFNRYSYCFNNPIICTDPSGYFSLGKFFKVAAIIAASVVTYGAVSGMFAIQGTVYLGATAVGTLSIPTLTGAIVGGAAAGFVGGALSTGTLEGALRGGVTGGITGGLGFELFGGQAAYTDFTAERLAANPNIFAQVNVTDVPKIPVGPPVTVTATRTWWDRTVYHLGDLFEKVMYGLPVAGGAAVSAIRYVGKAGTLSAAKGEAAFFRGAKPGEAVSFVPRQGIDFAVDRATGFVKETRGLSVFDNELSVISKGMVPHRVDLGSIPDSLRIIQRGFDLRHFEIAPKLGANLTPQQYINACSSIVCVR